ncbi:MAG: wax ester/triacylglycerol synthase family O-acyltransferase [Burkholderiales bacterium]|nr:wax ester/triacylglycerol synthase family O-acyltransferase [Burkholderiales bacterium]
MKQLSGADNLFLALEQGNQTAHVAGLGLYDPSTAPGGAVRFKGILGYFESRLGTSKAFRRRLVRAPLNLDRPYWVDEATVDMEFHVRHIALPQPGDWRQLCIQVARLHARPLDLSRPAWEAYVIEGLDHIEGLAPGSFALYIKFHHAAVDGEAGAAVIGALHSLSPLPEVAAAPAAATIADREPTTVELLARSVGNRYARIRQASRLAIDLGPVVWQFGLQQIRPRAADDADAAARDPDLSVKQAPPTRFNTALSPHRVMDAVPLPLDAVKRVRAAHPGATLNDIFMTVSAGALRRYLEKKKELPEATLNAMIPISLRGEIKDADAGNQVGLSAMPLFTNIAGEGKRLQMIHRGSAKGKSDAAVLGKDLPGQVLQVLPTSVAEFAMRRLLLPKINLTISNVRGPSVPLYMAGARLTAFIPINMLLDGMGLSLTGFSYNGALWVGVIACRQMMPDPALFAQGLRESFAALLDDADALLAKEAQAAKPAARPAAGRSRAAKPPARKTAKAVTAG